MHKQFFQSRDGCSGFDCTGRNKHLKLIPPIEKPVERTIPGNLEAAGTNRSNRVGDSGKRTDHRLGVCGRAAGYFIITSTMFDGAVFAPTQPVVPGGGQPLEKSDVFLHRRTESGSGSQTNRPLDSRYTIAIE